MSTIAVYPGTFDPITMGHVDLAARAAAIFNHLIVAVVVGAGGSKKPLFTTEERVALAKESLAKYPNIEVIAFDGLLAHFAEEQGARVVIRGLRAVSDYEYETQLAGINRFLVKDLETLFLTSDHKYTFVSSSLIKEVASHHGNVSEFLHPSVLRALKEKQSHV